MMGCRDLKSVNGTKMVDGMVMWGGVVNMPTTIIPVVKLKGHSVAVGSIEPKDLLICMH